MAEPRKSKPRLTLRDLASVEVPSASVEDVLGGMKEEVLSGPQLSRSASMSVDAATVAPDTPAPGKAPERPEPVKSGPVSTRQLEALPEGVSPEVAAMLGLPEAASLVEPEPEPEPVVEAVAPAPAPEPEAEARRGGTIAGFLLLAAGAAVAVWYGTRPPALDGALFETSPVTATAPTVTPEVQVAFLPVPDPIVVEPTPVAAPPERGSRGSRSSRTEVREEDLF